MGDSTTHDTTAEPGDRLAAADFGPIANDTQRSRARRLLAEVLTIVVGILLALSADQWTS